VTRPARTLIGHSLRRVRTLVIVSALVLAVFQVLTSLMAATFEESQAFTRISALVPDFIRQLMGPALLGMLSYAGIVCLGYFHFAVVGWLVGVAVALATEPTAEIEHGFADLILAHPVPRRAVIARSVVVVAVSSAVVLAMMMAGTWIGLVFLAPPGVAWPRPRLILSLTANLGALMFCWAGVALAISAATRRRAAAVSTTGILALGSFLFDYVARVWNPAKTFAWISPFHYYNPLTLLMSQSFPLRHVLVLVGVGAIGSVAAWVVYSRRDI
jgi:ABC-2 type transport system permease protein